MQRQSLSEEQQNHFTQPPPTEAISQESLGAELPVESGTTASAEAMKLTEHLKREAQTRRAEYAMITAWCVLLAAVVIRAGAQFSVDYPSMVEHLRASLAIFLILFSGMVVHMGTFARRRKRDLTRVLGNSRDRGQLGALVSLLPLPDTAVRHAAKQHLIALLPQVKASDASLFGADERTILIRRLATSPIDPAYRELSELFSRQAYRREVALRVAILKAMEQVGGERELPYVEALAKEPADLPRSYNVDPEIRAAARECLPFLRAHVEDQKASTQLLRASSGETELPAELLRASASRQEDTGTLLRAGDVGTRTEGDVETG